ncbi:MAG: hypothetical protein LBM92_04785, partial [Opitutaceae bacterium]|nr:hypothetical protein [Opitutaceae bacterium]
MGDDHQGRRAPQGGAVGAPRAMYLFYIDDSGNRDPETKGDERVYVLAAVGVYEKRWRAFEDEIMHEKLRLLGVLKKNKGLDLSISDTEVKSNYLRRADAREK